MDSVVRAEGTAISDSHARVLRLSDGRRIGYAEFGDARGLPVLAIHGTPGSRYMFALTDHAARERGLRIIAPERPGYGLSDYHRRDALAHTAEDVNALAGALGLDRFALIGVSGGGPHAMAAAASMPDRVALLALVSPVGPIADCHRRIRMSAFHRLVFTRAGRSKPACASFFWSLRNLVRWAPGVAHAGLMRRVTPSDRTILTSADVRANLRAAVGEGLRPGIKGALQDLRLFCGPWNLPLAEINVPTIMWQGSDDTIVPPQAAYHLAETLPNCRLDVVQGAGHYWVFAQFARVLEAVQAALRRR
jgi:pimeloyl-ACP methyl ester carboxylesterase